MIPFKTKFIVWLVLFASLTVNAADSLHVKNFQHKEKSFFKAIRYKDNKRVYLGSAAAIGLVSAWTITYSVLDQKIRDGVVTASWTDGALTVFDKIEPIGKGRNIHFAIGATFVSGLLAREPKLQKLAIVWAGGFILSDVIVGQSKAAFQRYRPNAGLPAHTFGDNYGTERNNSLPSQHTANVFVSATVIASLFPEQKWVAPVAYSVAGLVGVQRVLADSHWASDVIAGAAVGFLSGKAIVWAANKLDKKLFKIYPKIGANNYSLSTVLLIR